MRRLILTPGQSGGAIPLIPIFAGLSALGSLMSGSANECYVIKNTKNQILTQIDDFNNVIDYFGVKSVKKITFDIGIDQIDFRKTIISNGTICFNVENSIGPLLGFEKKNYEPRMQCIDGYRSQKVTNLNSINSIKVTCNIARGSFNNHMSSHSIYEFSAGENIGSKLIQIPNNLIYYKLNKTNIDSITIQLVDQDHNPINNLGQVSDARKVNLTYNGFSYLFEQIRLEINGIKVDSTRVLSITSSIKGYLSDLLKLLLKIPSTFLSNAPIVVIDTSKQNASATASSVDIQLEIEVSESL
ncbi:Uncharacterized protein FWK35_00034574, partial [Aphis craccivora]